jgi:hypothetical protein
MATKPDDMTAMQDDPKMQPDNPGESASAPGSYEVKLDMTNPDVAEAFANCEVGEQLTVKSKDDAEIVLAKESEPEANNEGDEPAPDAVAEPTSAVGRLMAKKMSR